MKTTFFKTVFGVVIALSCASISGQERGFVEACSITTTPAQATRNPESLRSLAARALIKNTDILFKVIITAPIEILDMLLAKIDSTRDADGNLSPSYNERLQMAVDSDMLAIERACYIFMHFPKLSCEKLATKVYALIKQQSHLSRSIITFIAKTLNLAAISKGSFEKIFPEGLLNHSQVQEVALASLQFHRSEIQPWCRKPQCFVMHPYEGPIPPVMFVFNHDSASIRNQTFTLTLTTKKESRLIKLAGIGNPNQPLYAAFPVAINNNENYLALQRMRTSIELYYLPHDGTSQVLMNLLTLKMPANFAAQGLVGNKIAFSEDNQWLLVENAAMEKCYFQLPLQYLSGRLSLEQIAFMRILLLSTSSADSQPDISFDIPLAHTLLNCQVLESFHQPEQSMFRALIKQKHTREQERRTYNMQKLHQGSPSYITSFLNTYALPGESAHLGKDLAGIQPRLAKKICRAFLAMLKKAYPEKDFSRFDFTYIKSAELNPALSNRYEKDQAFSEYMQQTIHTLGDHYATLTELMEPEEFKQVLCKLIGDALQQYHAYS